MAILILFNTMLIAQESTPKSFRFVVLGDNRPGKDGKVSPVFIKMIDQISKMDPAPAFVVHTGDIVSGGKTEVLRKQFDDFKKAIEPVKMPFYITPGNHEINDSVNNEILFRQTFGSPYQSFNFENSHFILLSSEIPSETNRIIGNQYNWLQKDLKKNKGVENKFVFIHAPFYPVSVHVGDSMDQYPQDRNQVFDLLKRYKISYIFAGHEHLYNKMKKDGVTQIITGGAGAPLYTFKSSGGYYHYLVVTVNGDDVKVDVVKVDK
jgi:3',5'-cyclic AMP phosphodiesterase CpdA